MASTKPEVHKIIARRQWRTDRAMTTSTYIKIDVKIDSVLF